MRLSRTVVSVRAALLTILAFAPLHSDEKPVAATEMARHERGFGALQQGTRTFTADIVQTLTLQGLAKSLMSKGVLSYAAPDQLLIRFSQPEGEWMLVNGKQAAVKKQGKPVDLHDMSASGKGGSHTASLLDFFRSGPDHWHNSFDVAMTRDGNRILVHLKPWMTPTSTFQGVDSITTTLQLPAYEIVSMDIAMAGSNRIRYEFSNIHRNVRLDEDLFDIPEEKP